MTTTVSTSRDLGENMTLTESHAPADESAPVLETTVGSILRAAAADSGDMLALIEGIDAIDERRTWTFAELLTDASESLALSPTDSTRASEWPSGLPTSPNGYSWNMPAAWPASSWSRLTLRTSRRNSSTCSNSLVRQEFFHLPNFRGNNMSDHLHAVLPDLPERYAKSSHSTTSNMGGRNP